VRVSWRSARTAAVQSAPRSASLPAVAYEIPQLGSDHDTDPLRADP
jgi:hypothetical protein